MRNRFDTSRPDMPALVAEIVHGSFLTSGTMVAFPLCFPSVSVPPPPDESRVTAITTAADGTVYAGTSGRATHLLVGMFHGITGMVFDMGVPEGADETVALCCGTESFAAAVNGPEGGRFVVRQLEAPPFDLIQEWHISRVPLRDVTMPDPDARLLHATVAADGALVIGLTDRGLVRYAFGDDAATAVDGGGDVAVARRLAVADDGAVIGLDGPGHLFRYDPVRATLERRAVALPGGRWAVDGESTFGVVAVHDPRTGVVHLVDLDGVLYSYDSASGFSEPLARFPLTPVSCAGITFDGRVFAAAGEGMARFFCYDPTDGSVADLGGAVSTLECRRYGYSFADAATGRDGEIIFAEDDDGGHLWLYFPSIRPGRA